MTSQEPVSATAEAIERGAFRQVLVDDAPWAVPVFDALAAALERAERELERMKSELLKCDEGFKRAEREREAYIANAAENARLAQEAERERDHYRFHFDQQEQRAEAAERERDEWKETARRESEGWQLAVDRGRALQAAEQERDEAREALREIIELRPPQRTDGVAYVDAREIAESALASPAAEGERYDERTSELDIPGAERGWTGAPVAEAVQALRRLGLTPILPTDDPERGQRMQDD